MNRFLATPLDRSGVPLTRPFASFQSRTSGAKTLLWIGRRRSWIFLSLVVAAISLRVLLILFSPTPFGYIYDFYHHSVEKFYELARLPESTECMACYHPPLFQLAGLPLYWFGHLIADPGYVNLPVRVLSLLPMLCGIWSVFYCYRILKLFRFSNSYLVLGTAMVLIFPCLFISSYDLEADILLTAVIITFVYYLLLYYFYPRQSGIRRVLLVGALAGLAMATKYNGLIALLLAGEVLFIQLATGHSKSRIIRNGLIILTVCLIVGSWKYIDNYNKYGSPLFANGTAGDGFTPLSKKHWEYWDFFSFRLQEVIHLASPEAPPGKLTDMPVYRSVWTSLHAMAWGDMSFFSEPTRHGSDTPLYPGRGIPVWLTGSVLYFAVLPNVLALTGFLVTLTRKMFWPLVLLCVNTFGIYFIWVVAQTEWALKTKYILFLLPVYIVYALIGFRWLQRILPAFLQGFLILWMVLLILLTHGYLFAFAKGIPAALFT